MAGIAVFGMVWDINTHHRGFSRWVTAGSGTITSDEVAGCWDAIEAAFGADRSWLASNTALTKLTFQTVEFVGATGGNRFHPTGVQFERDEATSGTGSSSVSSPQVTYRVTLRTLLPGKSYRGRTYFPSPPEGSVDNNGVIADAAKSSLDDFCEGCIDGMNTALTGISWRVVVPSFLNGTTQPVLSAVVRDTVGTQRRRLKATAVA